MLAPRRSHPENSNILEITSIPSNQNPSTSVDIPPLSGDAAASANFLIVILRTTALDMGSMNRTPGPTALLQRRSWHRHRRRKPNSRTPRVGCRNASHFPFISLRCLGHAPSESLVYVPLCHYTAIILLLIDLPVYIIPSNSLFGGSGSVPELFRVTIRLCQCVRLFACSRQVSFLKKRCFLPFISDRGAY